MARKDDHPRPALTVDVVVFTILDSDLKLLLIRRDLEPYRDSWALPGGFVREDEDLMRAAERELTEETSLPREHVFLEQLYTFGAPARDPRERVVSVAHYALVRPELVPLARAASDAAETRWYSVASELPGLELAFDHEQIVELALERIRGKLDYAPIGFELVPRTFTVSELRGVFEAIKGTSYDPANFRRRFRRMLTDKVIEEAPGKRQTGARPATVYRFTAGG